MKSLISSRQESLANTKIVLKISMIEAKYVLETLLGKLSAFIILSKACYLTYKYVLANQINNFDSNKSQQNQNNFYHIRLQHIHSH